MLLLTTGNVYNLASMNRRALAADMHLSRPFEDIVEFR